MSPDTTQDKRSKRVEELLEAHGIARMCAEDLSPPFGRFALMESDEGAADNGGPWWSFSDDWPDLLEASASQEYPEDWPADMLFDLDSEWSTNVRLFYKLEEEPAR